MINRMRKKSSDASKAELRPGYGKPSAGNCECVSYFYLKGKVLALTMTEGHQRPQHIKHDRRADDSVHVQFSEVLHSSYSPLIVFEDVVLITNKNQLRSVRE